MQRRNNTVRLSDVAKYAEVGLTTASVVLNGARSATRVSDTTRDRIHKAAATLGYHRSAIATALSVGHTDIIGIYTGYHYFDARNPFYTEIFGGLQDGCNAHGKDLLTHAIDLDAIRLRQERSDAYSKGIAVRGPDDDRSAEAVFRRLVNGKIDGLILHLDASDPIVAMLADSHLPAIAIVDAVPSLPSVVVDDLNGSRLLARYLAERGHKRILYRAKTDPRASLTRREEAFCAEAAALGLTVIKSGYEWPAPVTSEEKAILALPKGQRPTAAVCWNDNVAYSLIDECPALGIRVPDDLAVVGFDGFIPFPRYAMNLTTIRAPWGEVARQAVALLVAKLQGDEVPPETILPVEFVQGDTA